MQGYPEWNWIIGTGVYVDDINAAVATDLRRIALEIGLAGILLTWLILLVRRQVTRRLTRMTALLQGSDLRQRLDEGGGRTELCRLAAAVNKNRSCLAPATRPRGPGQRAAARPRGPRRPGA